MLMKMRILNISLNTDYFEATLESSLASLLLLSTDWTVNNLLIDTEKLKSRIGSSHERDLEVASILPLQLLVTRMKFFAE
jgi:hypothetical protein